MNLLIAILSNTYSIISRRLKLELAAILFESYKDKRIDIYYSSIIMFPVPFNMISFIFVPFIIILKNQNLYKLTIHILNKLL
jgi:hypothetical protein